nr:hypothetical protein BaRGS_013413 [Batillaria attramentaria]
MWRAGPHWRSDPYKFETSDIDTSLCTHVVWNHAELDSTGLNITVHDNGDEEILPASDSMKADQPSLKVLLDIRKLVSSQSNMQTFAANAIKYLRQFNFDGLVIDWEYPSPDLLVFLRINTVSLNCCRP